MRESPVLRPACRACESVGAIVPYRQRQCLCPHLFCRFCACGISAGNVTCAKPAKNLSGDCLPKLLLNHTRKDQHMSVKELNAALRDFERGARAMEKAQK